MNTDWLSWRRLLVGGTWAMGGLLLIVALRTGWVESRQVQTTPTEWEVAAETAAAGVSIPLFAEREYPTLGVCLGHQALCAAHGTPVGHAPTVVHGKPSEVRHDGTELYDGIDDPFEVGRYHSLAVESAALPDTIEETAHTNDEQGIVMGVQHAEKPHIGVQFHPESILTDAGKQIVENFCTGIARA